MNKGFIVTESKQKDRTCWNCFWQIQYYEDTIFWNISMNLHSISSKDGVQILTCFQMNKSEPLQVISKLVTSDGLLMHLLWSSLSSRWWDFGCRVLTVKRGIWFPSGLCCLSAAQNIFYKTGKKKKNACFFAHLLCIEICQNNPLPHTHTHAYTHSIKLNQTGLCGSRVFYARPKLSIVVFPMSCWNSWRLAGGSGIGIAWR